MFTATNRRFCAGALLTLGSLTCLLSAGCGGGSSTFEFLARSFESQAQTAVTGPSSTGRETGSSLGGDTSGFVDPCNLPQTEKFVRISMRNLSRDYIHYFLVFIAFVNSDTYPEGAVCPDDVSLYTQSGYTQIAEGASVEFGSLCIEGPALYRFHESGQFQSAGAGGGSNLAAAIAPAQGSTPSYDNFFGSAGARIPVPNAIVFHNPGTTSAGSRLLVADLLNAPCNENSQDTADPICEQDGWYYVDGSDRPTGSSVLGVNSYRRAPSEIQGTACECQGINNPFQFLATPGTSSANAACFEFFRGGTIEYVFIRDDLEPAYPQLLWRVTDSTGSEIHAFDPRAGIN